MSLVQIACQSTITKVRDWQRLDIKEQMEVLHQASSLFGESFRSSLNLIEKNPERVEIL